MANLTKKRKAEDTSVDGGHAQQKKRSIGVITQPTGYEVSNEDGDEFFAAQSRLKKATVTRKSESTRPSRPVEYEEDIGRTESQLFLELVKYGSKNKDSLKQAKKDTRDFQKTIQTQERGLHSEIKDQEAQLIAKEADFSETFQAAYSTLLFNDSAYQIIGHPIGVDPNSSTQSLHQKSAKVISDALGLTEQFQKSCGILASQETLLPLMTKWEDDLQHTKHILDVGKRVGEQKIDRILTGVREQLVDRETMEKSGLIYGKNKGSAQDVTWAKVVRKQEKAVMRLVNTLPLE